MRDKSAKLTVFLAAAGLTAASLGALAADGTPPMQGFTAGDATQQTVLEQKFDAALSADDQRDWNKDMASEHNEVGSPHDKANADTMLKQFQSWGWDAHIETFYEIGRAHV